jgi:hypothetical protein
MNVELLLYGALESGGLYVNVLQVLGCLGTRPTLFLYWKAQALRVSQVYCTSLTRLPNLGFPSLARLDS